MTQFQPIESSNLDSAAYDADAKVIIVRFKGGKAGQYEDCDMKDWTEFQEQFDGKGDHSAGKYLNRVLKAEKTYTPLDDWK